MVALGACLGFLSIDGLVAKSVSIRKMTEVYDSIGGLAYGNPDVLVLSSSHGRTFQVLADELAERTSGQMQLVAIPVEGGVLEAYEWVLEQRIKPLVDERRPDGRIVRDRLKRFIVATDYWDTCPGVVRTNPRNHALRPTVIPRSAWQWKDYAGDVLVNGITPYNRNFVRRHWIELFSFSSLAINRYNSRSELDRWLDALRSGRREDYTGWYLPLEMSDWQRTLEQIGECAGREDRAHFYERFIQFANERGLDLTFVLFPKLPETVTPRAMATTIASYRRLIDDVTIGKAVRVVDLFFTVPLNREHFTADLDHLNAEGSRRFAEWTLTNDLSFLLEPVAAPLPGKEALAR
jgi:hypothetical protein